MNKVFYLPVSLSIWLKVSEVPDSVKAKLGYYVKSKSDRFFDGINQPVVVCKLNDRFGRIVEAKSNGEVTLLDIETSKVLKGNINQCSHFRESYNEDQRSEANGIQV